MQTAAEKLLIATSGAQTAFSMAEAEDSSGVAVSRNFRLPLYKSSFFIHVETKNSYPKAIPPDYHIIARTVSTPSVLCSTYHIKTTLYLNVYVRGGVGGVLLQARVGSRKVEAAIQPF